MNKRQVLKSARERESERGKYGGGLVCGGLECPSSWRAMESVDHGERAALTEGATAKSLGIENLNDEQNSTTKLSNKRI